ncbi:MAG: tetratricopeptide repeat protein [Nonlabens sp.]
MKPVKVLHQKLLIIGLILLSFGGSLWNGYSLDDELVTTMENAKVAKGIAGIYNIVSSSYQAGATGSENFEYRPVTLISFAIEKSLFGFSTVAGHFINLLLYAIVVLLVFSLSRKLIPEKHHHLILFITALFAIHPLHSEVVLSLKNREELLVALFGLLGFIKANKFANGHGYKDLLWFMLFIGLGMFTKLSIAVYVLLIPVSLWFLERCSLKKAALLLFTPVLFLTVLLNGVLWIFDISLDRSFDFVENPLFFSGFMERLPMMFLSFFTYLKLLVVPHPLLSYYGYNEIPIVSWSDYRVLAGGFISVLGLAGLIGSFKKNKTLGFGLLTLFIGLSAFLNFPFPAAGIIAERFTFIAVWGWAIIVVVGLDAVLTMVKTTKLFQPLLIAAAAAFLYLNIDRTTDWNTKESLITHDAAIGMDSFKLQSLLGDIHHEKLGKATIPELRQRHYKHALLAYQKASFIYEDSPELYNSIGLVFFKGNQFENALKMFDKAIELDPEVARYYFNQAVCLESLDKMDQAISVYRKSLKINSKFQPSLSRLKTLNANN